MELFSELLSVPADLRVCLETCLSDVPSQATLEKHLPGVRQIIIGLLTGLREKQKLYREGVALRKAKDLQEREAAARREIANNAPVASNTNLGRTNSISGNSTLGSTSSNSPDLNQLTPASAGRSRDQLRKFVTQTQSSSGSGATQSLPATRSSTPIIPTTSYHPPPSSPPPPPPSLPPPVISPPSPAKPQLRLVSDPPASTATPRNPQSPSSSPSTAPKVPTRRTPSISEPPSNTATIISSRSTNSIRDSNRSSKSTDGTESFVSLPSLPSSTSLAGTLGNFTPHSPQRTNSVNRNRRSSPPPPPREQEDRGPVPTTPTDFQNLGSFPFPLPVIARSPSIKLGFEDPFSPSLDVAQDAAQLRSLENLKSSDNLSRRASKRFSAYAIQKITTGGSSPGRNGEITAGTSQKSNGSSESGSSAGKELSGLEEKRMYGNMKKKSEFRPGKGLDSDGRAVPPFPSSTSYEGDLRATVATIREEGEHTPPRWSTTPSIPISESTTQFSSPARSFTSSLPTERPSPASTISAMPQSNSTTSSIRQARQQPSEESDSEPVYPLSVYLQIGKDVKKAKLESIPTVASLRVHFIERFQYNPGQSDFPSIYLRDPVIGIQYELEDMAEIKNGSVLSLNIDCKFVSAFYSFKRALNILSHSCRTSQDTFRSRISFSISRIERFTSYCNVTSTCFDTHFFTSKYVTPISENYFTFPTFRKTISRCSQERYQIKQSKQFYFRSFTSRISTTDNH